MKNEIIKIAEDLEQGTVTTEQARTLLLGLFGVSNFYYRADMEYAYNADREWQSFDKFIEEYDAPT